MQLTRFNFLSAKIVGLFHYEIFSPYD